MTHMFQIVTCYNIFLVSGAAVQKPGSLPGTFNYPSYVQHIMGWVNSLPFQTHMTTVVKAVETRTGFFLCVVLFNGTTMGQGFAWKLCVVYYWVKDFQTILSFTCIVALCVWRTGNEPSSLASFPGPPTLECKHGNCEAYTYSCSGARVGEPGNVAMSSRHMCTQYTILYASILLLFLQWHIFSWIWTIQVCVYCM